MKTKLYIISGLGVDERIFQRIDFSGFDVIFIQWIEPLNKETLEEYAKRLHIQITTQKPILIGCSFGGMLATEIAKQLETEKVILLSSAKTRSELPFYFRWIGKLRIHKMVSVRLMKKAKRITAWFFSANTDLEKDLLKQIIDDTDPVFMKWALNAIVTWKNETIPPNLIHIHGTSDRILPFRYTNANMAVQNGGHFMVFNKAEELTKLIQNELNHQPE